MEIEMIVEIPQGSRNKYEMDHDTGAIWLDRTLFTATQYPLDYGFFPNTLGEDGDPLDALILLPQATFPGCHIWARPIGVFWMEDEKGRTPRCSASLHVMPGTTSTATSPMLRTSC